MKGPGVDGPVDALVDLVRFSYAESNSRLRSAVNRVAVLAFNLDKKILELGERSDG